jgi:hypothetical protein
LCLTNLMADDAPPLTYHTMKVDGLAGAITTQE